MKVYDEMGRPELNEVLDHGAKSKEFAERYNKEETENGDIQTFKGTNGDIHVVRHGQTQDNLENKFRSGNTNLTDEGIQQARQSGRQLKEMTGGNVPKIISSDLPRTIHSSNIIHEELSGEGKAPGVEKGAAPQVKPEHVTSFDELTDLKEKAATTKSEKVKTKTLEKLNDLKESVPKVVKAIFENFDEITKQLKDKKLLTIDCD
jgi:broad specificity phosphatase PhoE